MCIRDRLFITVAVRTLQQKERQSFTSGCLIQWYLFRQTCKRRSQIPLNLTLTIALTLLTLMVTVSSIPNPTNPTYPTNPTNPTTKYRCELGMCCLTWYKNLGPPFTGMPLFNAILTLTIMLTLLTLTVTVRVTLTLLTLPTLLTLILGTIANKAPTCRR